MSIATIPPAPSTEGGSKAENLAADGTVGTHFLSSRARALGPPATTHAALVGDTSSFVRDAAI